MISRNDIDALVSLAGHLNDQELTSCLVDNVCRISESAKVSVYEVYQNSTGSRSTVKPTFYVARITGDSIRVKEPAKNHDGFSESIEKNTTVRMQGNDASSTRIVFPVSGTQEVIGLLEIECGSTDPETLYMIEAMSKIWNSHKLLLDRNERDTLTGLLNRQALVTRIPRIFGQNRVSDPTPKCMAILDMDHFKAVNDTFGHLFGDEVLVLFVRLMTQSFRPYDYLFRYGGEEFVVMLENVDLEIGLKILDRFCKTVEKFEFPRVGHKTVSIGVIEVIPGEMPSTLLDKADKALYYAKEHGRNQVCAYEHLIATGKLQVTEVQSGDIQLF